MSFAGLPVYRFHTFHMDYNNAVIIIFYFIFVLLNKMWAQKRLLASANDSKHSLADFIFFSVNWCKNMLQGIQAKQSGQFVSQDLVSKDRQGKS